MEMAVEIGEVAENATANQLVMLADEMGKCAVESAVLQTSFSLGNCAMGCDILVDGYNVIKKNLMFQHLEIKNLALARDTLIQQLKNRYRQTPYQVIVVFDGNDTREWVGHDEHIRIIFSCHGQTADSVIARLAIEAREAGREVVLYSDDEEVKQNVVEQGGTFMTTRQLVARLNAAPRDVVIRSQHRQAMRRVYGIDPWYKPDDDLEPSPQVRKKKKKSSRRSH
jgi:predicted RNA-binding protein with PIN domain